MFSLFFVIVQFLSGFYSGDINLPDIRFPETTPPDLHIDFDEMYRNGHESIGDDSCNWEIWLFPPSSTKISLSYIAFNHFYVSVYTECLSQCENPQNYMQIKYSYIDFYGNVYDPPKAPYCTGPNYGNEFYVPLDFHGYLPPIFIGGYLYIRVRIVCNGACGSFYQLEEYYEFEP